jgi:hypothetical protein
MLFQITFQVIQSHIFDDYELLYLKYNNFK